MAKPDLARFASRLHADRTERDSATLGREVRAVGIVGDRPESGVRVDIVRPVQRAPPWRYRGEATTHLERFTLAVEVSAEGEASVELPPEAPRGLAERVRLLVRAAWKHTHQDDLPPPRRIVRWRPDG